MPWISYAQIDFNQRPDDDLGNVEDNFQEFFFEALKQSGIENYDRAVDFLLRCERLNDQEPAVYLELGKNYFLLKDYEKAETAFLKGLKLKPDEQWLLDKLYEVYVQQNNTSKAIDILLQLKDKHPDYKQDLASLYMREQRFNKALILLDELDNNFGVSPVRTNMRSEIFKQTAGEDNQISQLQTRIKENPANEANYLALIYSYEQNNQRENAFQTAQQLLKEIPDSELVHVALYKFYLENNQAEQAFISAEKALISTQVNNNDKTIILQNLLQFVGNNPQYEGKLIQLTALIDSEKTPESLTELAAYYLEMGDKQKALETYQQALQQNPTDYNLLKNSLLLQLDLGQYQTAANSAEQALALYPAQSLLYLISGVANNQLKQPQKAINSLEMGLEFLIDNPKMQADIYIQLSEAYKQLNNIEQSKAFAEKAAAINKAQ